MSLRTCCVPGCFSYKGGVKLHRFPNPETEIERFRTWMMTIGGDLVLLENKYIYNNRKVCSRHFHPKHVYTKKLSTIAIPQLHLPDSARSPKKKRSKDSERENNNHERCESEKKSRTSGMNCSVCRSSKYDKSIAPAPGVPSGSEWSEHISSCGKKYYYNCTSEVSQWEKPREWDSRMTSSRDTTYSSRSSEPKAALPTIVNLVRSSVFVNDVSKQNIKCKTRGVTRRKISKIKGLQKSKNKK